MDAPEEGKMEFEKEPKFVTTCAIFTNKVYNPLVDTWKQTR